MSFAAAIRDYSRRRTEEGKSPQPFPIFDPSAGLKLDREPWLLPTAAFSHLDNYWIRNGRITKRLGYSALSPLAQEVSETADGAPHSGTSVIVNGTLDNVPLDPKGTYYITFDDGVNFTGATILEARVDYETTPGSGAYTIKRASDGASAGAINTSQNLYTLTVALLTPSTFGGDVTVTYRTESGDPVMGLIAWKDLSGNEHLVANDTKRLYTYNISDGLWDDQSGSDVWTGEDDDFFTYAPFDDVVYISNGVDEVRTYTPATTTTATTDYDLGSGDINLQAKIILPHRRRLVAIDTVESGADHRPRVRLSDSDDPTTMTAGNAADMTTGQTIKAAAVQGEDDIILFLETGSILLHYTGDDFRFPYTVREGSDIYGSASRVSPVAYEGAVFARSLTNLIAARGRTASEVDGDIPELVSTWNDEASKYTYGIVVPEIHQILQSYAATAEDYPNNLLSFDYRTGFVTNYTGMPFHCFGRYSQQTALLWDDILDLWDDVTLTPDDPAGTVGAPLTLAGDRDGKVWILFTGATDDGATITAKARTKRLSPDRSRRWEMTRIRIMAAAFSGGALTVRVYKGFEDGSFVTRTLDLTPDNVGDSKVERFLEVGQVSPYFEIEIESADGFRHEIDIIEPWFVDAGPVRNV